MNKLYFFIVTFLLVNSSIFIQAQESNLYGGRNEYKNYLYGDFSSGILNLAGDVRINYERQIFRKNIINLCARTGAGAWFDYSSSGTVFPLSIQALFFKSSSHLELGFGTKWLRESNKSEFYKLINIGYRYQDYGNKLILRFNLEYDGEFLIPLISFGTSF